MTTLALETMARRLTTPFARGASTQTLFLAASDATGANIADYTFSEYIALYDVLPATTYILVVLRDIPQFTRITIDYKKRSSGASSSVTLTVPAGALAGTSFVDWRHVSDGSSALKVLEDTDVQLTLLHMSPPAPDSDPASWWGLTALLGTMAKLLWVIGWEKNVIRRQLEIVREQRFSPTAIKYSLDRLGDDLGVPRFPPQPYSLDASSHDTIALYHLDEPPGATVVTDAIASYPQTGLTAHPGNVNGAISGVVGRFSTGFAFRDKANSAEILVADHADFVLDTTTSFTVECFVKPDAGTPEQEKQVDHREIVAKHPDPTETTMHAGWALSLGAFQRQLPLNVRFLLSDGVNPPLLLFADFSLSNNRFYHLAGVIDRIAQQARLYVDGLLVSVQALDTLGALSNTEPLRIGRSPGAAYRGYIDEVRLSRVARSSFHPVLGENDEVYRDRLKLFRSWSLPAHSELLQMLNAASGPIGGDAQPLILNEINADLTGGTVEVAINPTALEADISIDALGNRGGDEASINGTAVAETDFEPIYLVKHDDARVLYDPVPSNRLRLQRSGEPLPDTHSMQLVVARRLNQLLDMLGSSGVQLRIISAFDSQASDLRAVGRGLLIAPIEVNATALAQLAAQAYAAGFTFVCNRSDLQAVYVSTEQSDYIEIAVVSGETTTPTNGFPFQRGETLQLMVQPMLPPDTRYRWLLIPGGAGRAEITSPRTDLSSVALQATASGTVNVKIEVMRRQHVVAGTSTLRVNPIPDDLIDGTAIGDDGAMDVDESSAGTPNDSFFHPVYLVTHEDPKKRVTYGDVNTRRMQPAVASNLDRLLSLIPDASTAGQQLQIVQAYVPATTAVPASLSEVGRALTLSHPTIAPGNLAVMAHAAGFTYVRRQGNQVIVRQKADELLVIKETIEGNIADISGQQVLAEGQSTTLTITPRATPASLALSPGAVYVANAGSDTLSEIDPQSGLIRRAIKVGWKPLDLVLSPDGKRLYTADFRGNTVTALDVSTGNIVGVIPVPAGPLALAHHPNKQRLYVACGTANSLVEIDTTALRVLTAPPLQVVNPTSIALTPDGSMLWVAQSGAAQIALVSTNPLAIAGNIALAAPPRKIAIAANGARACVTLQDSIVLIDVANRTIIQGGRVVLPGGVLDAVAFAPDSSAIYVTDSMQKQIWVLDPKGTVVERISVQQRPTDIAAGEVLDAGGAVVTKVMVAAHDDDDVVLELDLVRKGVLSSWRLGSGLGERISWVFRPGPATQVHLSSATTAATNLKAVKAGPVLVRALYMVRDSVAPYTFEIRLKPALENLDSTVIHKDQYDRIMNVLNAFHPVGVEVITRAIRERVIEVRDSQLLNAFPNYTYPNFRVHGVLPRRIRKD